MAVRRDQLHPDDVVVVGALRSPVGENGGVLHDFSPVELAVPVGCELMRKTGVNPQDVSHSLAAIVNPAGFGQAPDRQFARGVLRRDTVVTKSMQHVCGSGLEVQHDAADLIRQGAANLVLVSGMEAMSRSAAIVAHGFRGPYIHDGTMVDGLQDPYTGRAMGTFVDETARHWRISRAQQDEFAHRSFSLCRDAWERGALKDQVVPLSRIRRGARDVIERDEAPFMYKDWANRIRTAKPAFRLHSGSVTPMNSSRISDGAGCILFARASYALSHDLPIMAVQRLNSVAEGNPARFGEMPYDLTGHMLEKLGWRKGDPAYQINEAFAAVTLFSALLHGLPIERINMNGGAIAHGHPIGASGAIITIIGLYLLFEKDIDKLLVELCVGGGAAVGSAYERVGG